MKYQFYSWEDIMHPHLIVMLTHNDCTVENAAAVFERY